MSNTRKLIESIQNSMNDELKEASYSRIYQHTQDDSTFAIIGSKDKDTHEDRYGELIELTRKASYNNKFKGFNKVDGTYTYQTDEGGEKTIDYENSLILYNIDKQTALDIANAINQESIVWKDSDFFGLLYTNGEVMMTFANEEGKNMNFSGTKDSGFGTKLKNDKRNSLGFMFEGVIYYPTVVKNSVKPMEEHFVFYGNGNNKINEAEDYEEENEIDFDDTVSMLDKAISNIPEAENIEDSKFYLDTKKLLQSLSYYEEEIPRYYIDNAPYGDWYDGVDNYIEDLYGYDIEQSGNHNNTYNWSSKVSNDIEFTTLDVGDRFLVMASAHRAGDVRGNYTNEFLLIFNNDSEFYDAIFEAQQEQSSSVEVDGVEYTITPQFFSEYIEIYCPETGYQSDSCYADSMEELTNWIHENVNE